MQERERRRLSLVLRATGRATTVVRQPGQDLEEARVVGARVHPDGYGGFFVRVKVHDPRRSAKPWTRTIQAAANRPGYTKREAQRLGVAALAELEAPTDAELAGGAS